MGHLIDSVGGPAFATLVRPPGVFVPPQKVVGLNPTLVIRRAIELAGSSPRPSC